MFPKYNVEDAICLMTCAPGLEPVFEIYAINSDGTVDYIIKQRSKYYESEEKDA